MNRRRIAIFVLICLMAVTATVSSFVGFLSISHSEFYQSITPRREIVQYQAGGVYAHNPRYLATEAVGSDLATAVLAVPLLLVAGVMFLRGSNRGSVLLIGSLAYFLYKYLQQALRLAFNDLFLVYTLLIALSLVTLVLVLSLLSSKGLLRPFRDEAPRVAPAIFLMAYGVAVLIQWLPAILSPQIAGETPEILQGQFTLVLQAMDLGLLVPVAILAGVLLTKRSPYSRILASALLVKIGLMGLVLLFMAIMRSSAAGDIDLFELLLSSAMALGGIGFTIRFLANTREPSPY